MYSDGSVIVWLRQCCYLRQRCGSGGGFSGSMCSVRLAMVWTAQQFLRRLRQLMRRQRGDGVGCGDSCSVGGVLGGVCGVGVDCMISSPHSLARALVTARDYILG